jgi:nucleolar protein 56
MNATIIVCSFGILAFDESIGLVERAVFPKKPQAAAKVLQGIESGESTTELESIIVALRKSGYDTFVFENAALASEAEKKLGVHVEVSNPSPAGDMVRSDVERFALETGFAKDSDDFKLWMRNVTMELAKLKVKGTAEKRDLIVAQAIQSLDDLDKIINLLMSHVREWYGIHFPELDRLVDKHETYARLILDLGNKENYTAENLQKEDIPQAKAEAIIKVSERSMGADLAQKDLEQIQTLCRNVLQLYQLRQNMEGYLDKTMDEVAPNTKALAGSLLGARLIAIAGGISNLAKKPASTVQVLGAEKALFRSLKSGTRPPKHGMIFQHVLLHDAKRWQRGKIARALAGKLAIAARSDAFGNRYIGKELSESLKKRIEEIQQKYAEPPIMLPTKPKNQQPQRERDRRRNRRREGKR